MNEVYDFIRFLHTLPCEMNTLGAFRLAPSIKSRRIARKFRQHYPARRGRFAKHFDKDGDPSETLLNAKQERLENWRILQELAGSIRAVWQTNRRELPEGLHFLPRSLCCPRIMNPAPLNRWIPGVLSNSQINQLLKPGWVEEVGSVDQFGYSALDLTLSGEAWRMVQGCVKPFGESYDQILQYRDFAQALGPKFLRPLARGLSTVLARALVHLTAEEETQARYDSLAGKRTEGQLTPAELEELESLVLVNTFLSVLKGEARAVLAEGAGK